MYAWYRSHDPLLQVVIAVAAVIVVVVIIVKATAAPSSPYKDGYSFNAAYVAQYGQDPESALAFCGYAERQSSVQGIDTNSPGGDPLKDATAWKWYSGCEDGLTAGVSGR